MSESPLVSVVISIYNNDWFLVEALQSILNQTYSNFEILIVDDGSTDNSLELIHNFTDERIKVITNQQNIGLTRSLQKAVRLSQGKYIARMDGDDISLIDRLRKQVDFLEKYQNIGIVGTPCILFDNDNPNIGIYSVPSDDLEIRWRSLLTNPFAHPTIMFRKELVDTYDLNYDDSFSVAQDYELWTRFLKYTKGANLTEPLVKYRIGQGITKTKRNLQLETNDRIAYRTIKDTFPDLAISFNDVIALRSILFSSDDLLLEQSNTLDRGIYLIQLYWQMLQAFVSRYPQIQNIKHFLIVQISLFAKALLYKRRNSYSYKLLFIIFGLISPYNKGIVFFILEKIKKMIAKILKSNINKNNEYLAD
jgi:glycosyltransferase involved in cell wall biosynthesis